MEESFLTVLYRQGDKDKEIVLNLNSLSDPPYRTEIL